MIKIFGKDNGYAQRGQKMANCNKARWMFNSIIIHINTHINIPAADYLLVKSHS